MKKKKKMEGKIGNRIESTNRRGVLVNRNKREKSRLGLEFGTMRDSTFRLRVGNLSLFCK